MKKETRNRIIKWSLYALLVIATILIFVFSKYIFGAGKDSVTKTLPDGSQVKETIWTIQEPMFYNSNTGSAFADYFFPGTSTIQTRAKYFLIVPYALKDMEYSSETNPNRMLRTFDEVERIITSHRRQIV